MSSDDPIFPKVQQRREALGEAVKALEIMNGTV